MKHDAWVVDAVVNGVTIRSSCPMKLPVARLIADSANQRRLARGNLYRDHYMIRRVT